MPHKNNGANNSKYKKKRYSKKKEQAKRSRKRAIWRNKKYVENYKLKNPCKCGEVEPCCLSFHHGNGEKMANLSDMVNRGYSIKRIQEEIDKCTLLCLNCHTKLHNKKNSNNKEMK